MFDYPQIGKINVSLPCLQVVLSKYIFLYDTYKVFKENAIHWKYLGFKDIDAVDAYIKRIEPINITKEKRITFAPNKKNRNSSATTLAKGGFAQSLMLITSSFVIGLSLL